LEFRRVLFRSSKPGNMSFLRVYGIAQIINERARLEKLYGSMDDTWFDGVNDPNLCAIKVEPLEAEYWEPKHNKLVTLFKMGVGALTDSEPDLGNRGSLKI